MRRVMVLIAAMLLGILGNVADTGEVRSIVKRLVDAVPSGSYLVINDGTKTSDVHAEAEQATHDAGTSVHPAHPGTGRRLRGADGESPRACLHAGVIPRPEGLPATTLVAATHKQSGRAATLDGFVRHCEIVDRCRVRSSVSSRRVERFQSGRWPCTPYGTATPTTHVATDALS
jgi:hypothetical protein